MDKLENINNLINIRLNNEYIAGFVHADGSFSAPLIHNGNKTSKKLYLVPQLNIVQNKSSRILIDEIYKLFKYKGNIRLDTKDRLRYKITDLTILNDIIIPIFDKAQVRDKKLLNYLKFKFIVKKLLTLKLKGYDFSLNMKDKESKLYLDLIIISCNMNNLIKPSTQLRYLNNEEQNLVLNNEVSYETKKELDEFINSFKINSLTNHFINGLFDGDGTLSINIKLNRHNSLAIVINYSLISDIYNEKLFLEIKNYFNDVGSLLFRKDEKSLRYFVNKKDIISIILPKIYGLNSKITYEKMLEYMDLNYGPIIKNYKFKNMINILILYNKYINSNNNKDKLLLINKMINYQYNSLTNYKNISLEDYKKQQLIRLSKLIKDLEK